MTETLKTWRNLTDLRGIAKGYGIVRPNTKQIPELLEELARLDVAVSEVCIDEMATVKENLTVENDPGPEAVSDEPCEKVADEPEVPPEKVTKSPETAVEKVQRLSALVNELTEKLRQANKDLAKATNDEYEARAKPKTHAQLLKEQREQDAKARENANTVDAVALAQSKFLAGRERDARENMTKIMAEQMKKRA